MIIDCVIPARNEAATVADVVAICRACAYVREVIVVDDGSTDDTADLAAAAGAKVFRRDLAPDAEGSKAHAMALGVAKSDAEWILFVDADLLGASTAHLDAICRPAVEGRCTMSIGTFDYGIWNPLVIRFPPTTGERIIPRAIFEAIPPDKLDGYTIELMINEVVGSRGLRTVARVMTGVTHRTKRDKFGPLEGWKRTWWMFADLLSLWSDLRKRTYWDYLRNLTIEH